MFGVMVCGLVMVVMLFVMGSSLMGGFVVKGNVKMVGGILRK